MKQAEMGGGKEAGVAEVADPKIADNFAKVKVLSAPLCTEFTALGRYRRGGFGHEAAGEVVEIGPKVRSVAVGDRVVVMPQNSCGICDLCLSGEHIYCRSPRKALEVCKCETGNLTTAQYLIKQDWLLLKIPDEMSYDHASMACCGFGPAFNAMQSMEVSTGDTVLVSGLGPVGLGAVTVALCRGARVIGLDTNKYRRDLAEQLGAAATVNPLDEDAKDQVLAVTPGGLGAHKAVQCTRVEGAGQFLVQTTRHRGRIAFIGQGGTLEIGSIVNKGLRIYGCWHWNHYKDAERMLSTISGSAERLDQMITHTFPMSQIQKAFEVQVSGECGKVIVHPWED